MPKSFFEPHLFFCTNQRDAGSSRGCCMTKGSEMLRKYAKRRLKELGVNASRANSSGCLDRCELGPVLVIYPEGAWYRADTPEDIDEILSEHVLQGRPVARLRLPDRDAPQVRPQPLPTQSGC